MWEFIGQHDRYLRSRVLVFYVMIQRLDGLFASTRAGSLPEHVKCQRRMIYGRVHRRKPYNTLHLCAASAPISEVYALLPDLEPETYTSHFLQRLQSLRIKVPLINKTLKFSLIYRLLSILSFPVRLLQTFTSLKLALVEYIQYLRQRRI